MFLAVCCDKEHICFRAIIYSNTVTGGKLLHPFGLEGKLTSVQAHILKFYLRNNIIMYCTHMASTPPLNSYNIMVYDMQTT